MCLFIKLGRHVHYEERQSSTLTTGPKVLASKICFGLVKIWNLDIRRAHKHFTDTSYTRPFRSINLSPTGGTVTSGSCYVLTWKKCTAQWCSENHFADCKFNVPLNWICVNEIEETRTFSFCTFSIIPSVSCNFIKFWLSDCIYQL